MTIIEALGTYFAPYSSIEEALKEEVSKRRMIQLDIERRTKRGSKRSRKRECFQCHKSLNYQGYIERNIDLEIFTDPFYDKNPSPREVFSYYNKVWNHNAVELYCCKCYCAQTPIFTLVPHDSSINEEDEKGRK